MNTIFYVKNWVKKNFEKKFTLDLLKKIKSSYLLIKQKEN